MPYSFENTFSDLPEVLHLFPLGRVLLLPRARLPLNLFENRYLHMLDYALCHGRSIGIIQPSQRLKKNSDSKNPNLYEIGCAGYITAFSQTNDNRYEIILKGVCRFKVISELGLKNGFRRANVCWNSYEDDFRILGLKDKKKRVDFITILKKYLKKVSINADWEAIEMSTDEDLINSISMGCPFDQNEKQALLEAKCLDERAEILISLMKMSLVENSVVGSSLSS